ncbi:MAG: hypothetical protein ACFFDN_15565, partial [Candidatus Hodarchaeota archaeon]
QIAFDQSLHDKTVEIIGKDKNVDLILLFIGTLNKALIRGLLKVQDKIKKSIAIVQAVNSSAVAGYGPLKDLHNPIKQKKVPQFMKKLYNAGISVHPSEHAAAKVLMNLVNYSNYLKNQNK